MSKGKKWWCSAGSAERHGVKRELEHGFVALDDAQRVDGAHDHDEVLHDVGDVVVQGAVE